MSEKLQQTLEKMARIRAGITEAKTQFYQETIKPMEKELSALGQDIRKDIDSYAKPGLQVKLTEVVHDRIYDAEQYGYWNLSIGQDVWLGQAYLEYTLDNVSVTIITQKDGNFRVYTTIDEFIELLFGVGITD